MKQPENEPKKYDVLFAYIDDGLIKIPKFQRDFVWTKEQTAQLIDSIIKGFPIGTFILWKTREELKHFKNIGNINLPDPPKGDKVYYVLDGQQRITALYAVRKGAVLAKEGRELDYKDICINLDLDPEADESIVSVEPPENHAYISVHRLLECDLPDLMDSYSKPQIKKINVYQKRLITYDFSTIVINDYPLDIACEIFTRINTGGTELTLFEIMVAKTYDNDKNFDLAEKYDWLIDNNNHGKDLEDADFETIPPNTVLQCVSACMTGHIRRKDILKLPKNEFIELWPKVTEAIFTAVDYIRTHLRIPVSEMLPYNALLILFAYFFYKNDLQQPNDLQDKLLCQLFWWISIKNRYSAGMETYVAQDLERVDLILKEHQPSFQGEEVEIKMEDLRFRWFSTADAFCKAVLCIYAWFQPKSFNNDALVKIDNSWLKTSTSKNYHHFFPRSYLHNKKGLPDWQANSILNITIVDDHINKNKIKAKSPSDYMGQFKQANENIHETMKTHLIDDLDSFGIWEDDYLKFLEMRGARVIEEINKRLNFNQ